MDWHEVQTGIEGYYEEVTTSVNRDRFLKNKCNPFRSANITGRMMYFLESKIITKTDINPSKAAAKNRSELRQSVEDEEEEKMMLEFNNSFTKNKTFYDPSLLVGLELQHEELKRSGSRREEDQNQQEEEVKDDGDEDCDSLDYLLNS